MANASILDMDEATNIEEEARRAARKRAIDRLAEDLQNPDQLAKVRLLPIYACLALSSQCLLDLTPGIPVCLPPSVPNSNVSVFALLG